MTRVFITSAGVPIVAAAKAEEILDMACVICRKVELYSLFSGRYILIFVAILMRRLRNRHHIIDLRFKWIPYYLDRVRVEQEMFLSGHMQLNLQGSQGRLFVHLARILNQISKTLQNHITTAMVKKLLNLFINYCNDRFKFTLENTFTFP